MPNLHHSKIIGGLSLLLIIFLTAYAVIRANDTTNQPGLVSAITGVASSPDALGRAESINLTIFAAASLTEAFTELGQTFEATHPEISVTINFAGSQQLAQQLGQGAPADLYASANSGQMGAVIQAERVKQTTVQPFAHNQLVIIYPKNNSVALGGLADLGKPNLRLLLAAQEVPVGRYSLNFLENTARDPTFDADFQARVLNNVVSYEPNVKAIVSKVALGEADAGIVYQSDITARIADQVEQLAIPAALNIEATYFMAPITDSQYPDQADAFIRYVSSASAQAVLVKYGFIPRP